MASERRRIRQFFEMRAMKSVTHISTPTSQYPDEYGVAMEAKLHRLLNELVRNGRWRGEYGPTYEVSLVDAKTIVLSEMNEAGPLSVTLDVSEVGPMRDFTYVVKNWVQSIYWAGLQVFPNGFYDSILDIKIDQHVRWDLFLHNVRRASRKR